MATSSSRPQQAWLIHITNVDSHLHAQAHSLLSCFQDKRAEYFAEIVNILVTVGNISDCLPVHTSKDINNWTFAIITERKKKKKRTREHHVPQHPYFLELTVHSSRVHCLSLLWSALYIAMFIFNHFKRRCWMDACTHHSARFERAARYKLQFIPLTNCPACCARSAGG